MPHLNALVVDDDADSRASLAALAESRGYSARQAGSLAAARRELASAQPDLVFLDLMLPDGSGLELAEDPEFAGAADFVVVTGHADVATAVDALRRGALDYLTKPVDRARFETILANVARTRGLRREVSELRDELRRVGRFGRLVGRSTAMQNVYDLISRVAPTDTTVFVLGESGTGKEVVAETIHQLSHRKEQPYLALNCGAMSANLIESELFGHEKGSFTGADRRRRGYFEEATGGTLLLDEITEMPVELQVRLLRVLETGTVTRVGATEATAVDVRVIAASNRDPRRAVEEGRLREDLLYRLNVFPIQLPPLRDRDSDVQLLARLFLDGVNDREKTSRRFSDQALQRLQDLDWPGNVRELKNVVERAAILSDDVIDAALLPQPDRRRAPSSGASAFQVQVGCSIEDVERRLILATLEELGGDKKRAAEVLGISLKTLYNRLNVYQARQDRG